MRIAHYHPRGCQCQQCRAEIEAVRSPKRALILRTEAKQLFCGNCADVTLHWVAAGGQRVCQDCACDHTGGKT